MNDEYRALDPKAKTAMYITNGILFVISLAVSLTVFFLVKGCDWYNTWYAVLIFGVLAIVTVYLVVGPIVFYRFYRYLVNEDKIDVRRGILFKTRTVVPIERMHQVEVKRGPILSMLNLADVKIMTAGGTAVIEYLELDVAEKIAEDLNKKVNSIIRGRASE